MWKVVMIASAGIFFYCSPLLALWQGEKDNKAIAELELMTEDELIHEAGDACEASVDAMHLVASAPANSSWMRLLDRQTEAQKYLNTIMRVARKNHRGNAPAWATDMTEAAYQYDGQCQEIETRALSAQKKKARTNRSERK